jgi:hypothetical protein
MKDPFQQNDPFEQRDPFEQKNPFAQRDPFLNNEVTQEKAPQKSGVDLWRERTVVELRLMREKIEEVEREHDKTQDKGGPELG